MITLDSIVRNYMISHNRSTLHGYLRFLKYLIDFLRQVASTHAVFIKTISLKMDQKKAIQMPDGLLMPAKVGFQQGDRVVAFEIDNTINLNHEISQDGLESPTANSSYDIAKFPYTRLVFNNFTTNEGENGFLEGMGLGHNGVGYYRINWSTREIQFSSDIDADTIIYLEFYGNGFQPTTKSTVPDMMSKLGEDYIHWQEGRRKLGDAASETFARKKAYFDEYDDVMAKMNPISIAAIQGIRSRGYDVNKIVY